MPQPTRIGIIGCGNISSVYCNNLRKYPFLAVTACADLDPARAEAKAKEFGIPKACSTAELLADPAIDAVLNLTVPKAHAPIALEAFAAGKHVFLEKPLGLDRDEGKAILAAAKKAKRRVGCAPDTVLGGGIQTCRRLIDQGAIGAPVSALACMLGHGCEGWHPDPAFFYHRGGGPVFDMGPYYLTALVTLLGPVKRVTGCTRITFPERIIRSEPKKGQVIKVEVPTHVAGVLEFANGAVVTLITSFDVWHHHAPCIEIYGAEGSLVVPDPNSFGGTVKIRGKDDNDWREVPLTHGYTGNSRGVGLADMITAIGSGRPHRASGDLAFHILDISQALHESSDKGKHITLKSKYSRTAPMPSDLEEGKIDA
jgi:predicted dehydrogenase